MKYSFIVPVYNRPDEVRELLDSMLRLTEKDFEIIIVEDGSKERCEDVCREYSDRLPIHYYYKENGGPGDSRNYGAERAAGDFLLIIDSDVVLPEGYLKAIDDELAREDADAFGGPDAAHASFTPTQKAISYAMTSFFTTGGIRGGRKKLDKFYPRSFNMGIRREVFQQLKGFSKMRFGEDIDFSIRIFRAGFRCRLFPEAWVWHKRRTDFRKFWRQVYNSGIARINLYKRYPDTLKAVHLLPALFTIGVGMLVIVSAVGRAMMHYDPARFKFWYLVCACPWLLLATFSLVIFIDAALRNRSLRIGALAVAAAFVQLTGYGCGFLEAWWLRVVKRKGEYHAYEDNFYE